MGTCDRYDNLMWFSYARGRLDHSVAAEMESHSLSCADCRTQLDFSRKIAAIVDFNSEGPPDSWTEEAASRFEFVSPGEEPSKVFGELVFDSYLHDKEAVRSRKMEARRLIFDLPGFEVDLAMKYSGRRLNMLVGHLFSKTGDPAGTPQESALELRVATRVYETRTNRLGEFSFTVDAETMGVPMELRCTFKEGRCLVVLIPC